MSAPLLLPIRASEAVALAELIFKSPPTPSRLQSLLPTLGLQHTKVFPHTLAPDPIHADSWYLLVADAAREHWLLHLTSSAAPASTLFPKPLLLARARISSDFEIVANAIPALENLGLIVSVLLPHLLARASAIHELWSVPNGPDWEEWLGQAPLRSGALPAVRSADCTWDPYLPVLLNATPIAFAYILTNAPPDLSAEDAKPFSRFSLQLADLESPRATAERIKALRSLASRAIDIELDLSHTEATASEILAYCNNLHLFGASIEGIEAPAQVAAEDLSSPKLALTIAASAPRELKLPGPIHWKL